MAKQKPALLTKKTGDITAVALNNGDFCYLRTYRFGYGVLPFLSHGILREIKKFPSLRPAFFIHIWVYSNDLTPMSHIANIPFATEEESWGQPTYSPPDAIENCYKIHGVFNGIECIIKPKSEADVIGLEHFHRYQPSDLQSVLFSRQLKWNYTPVSDATNDISDKPQK
jgi:hypothetical protein